MDNNRMAGYRLLQAIPWIPGLRWDRSEGYHVGMPCLGGDRHTFWRNRDMKPAFSR
jgi:hypothetical protein